MTLPNLAAWNVRGFNGPEKVNCCKQFVKSLHLDIIFLLEAKISSSSAADPWFLASHKLFHDEDSYDNFDLSNPGRIWVKWNSTAINFSPITVSSQLIHGTIFSSGTPVCDVTAVYASNSFVERQVLWNQLRSISTNISRPWTVLGDFNCCRYPTEKAGGIPLKDTNFGDFNRMIFDTALHDLSSVGYLYSWFNQRVDSPIYIKLDRVLVNDSWLANFPNSFYKVGEPFCSDHSPLILSSSAPTPHNHRFMFKNYLTSKREFCDIFLDSFAQSPKASPLYSFCQNLKNLKNKLKGQSWGNANVLKLELDSLLADQNSLLSLAHNYPHDHSIAEALHNTNLKVIDCQTSLASWTIQRAKTKWLQNGEDDLKFLYSKINIRHSYNKIKEIRTDNGSLTSHQDISNAFINHFRNLFNTQHTTQSHMAHFSPGGTVPPHLAEALVAPVTMKEIKEVIFAGPNCSAPGPDGFTFAFYKATWSTISTQIFQAINAFFNTASLPKIAKATALALVPKYPHATFIRDYRPISLCNVIYKVIAKIIANRMKEVMPYIIHNCQGGFVQNRLISDNILLASEILGDFNKCSKASYFCAKFDITKAFDMVSREFLLHRLASKGFPAKFIAWIKACITEVHFSVCINGALEGFFGSSSGLRQGCPLSPYLFSIVIDALSTSFDEAVFRQAFTGVSSGSSSITHLLYADDLLVFGKATVTNAINLQNLLHQFACSSGLYVNPSKSAILFSNGCRITSEICSILHIDKSTNPIKYLGIPIFYRKLRASDFQPLILKISNSLDGWKAKTLSLAGRVQFIKFTICSTLAYWIRGAILP
ncbi:putative mitochondrial protein [Dendrobium catenatum]|uniref:Putative mitochondrial protein n=1 Tax=Dendrobium catenatum TaxID=906689 RepID=A0A2I0VV63_9ASPA|nr:putative mitochondrial protein [Dendrobium catenatum]